VTPKTADGLTWPVLANASVTWRLIEREIGSDGPNRSDS
jgi:hypothetical protein